MRRLSLGSLSMVWIIIEAFQVFYLFCLLLPSMLHSPDSFYHVCKLQTMTLTFSSFFAQQDMFIIIFSSLGNLLRCKGSPSRNGYTRADSNGRGGFIGAIGGRGRGDSGRDVDAENRLIDQLDEEWDD